MLAILAVPVCGGDAWYVESQGYWITDEVTETSWMDGVARLDKENEGFIVFAELRSEEFDDDAYIITNGTLTIDAYVEDEKNLSREFEISEEDFTFWRGDLSDDLLLACSTPIIPLSDLGISEYDIWIKINIEMTFVTGNGYLLEDNDTIYREERILDDDFY